MKTEPKIMSLERILKKRKRKKPKRKAESFRIDLPKNQRDAGIIAGAEQSAYIDGSVRRFSQLQPSQVDAVLEQIKEESAEKYREYMKNKEERERQARIKQERQATPFYRFGVASTYSLDFGTGKYGKKLADEVKTFKLETLKEILQRLDHGELPKPLENYPLPHINKCRDWLLSVIRAKEA